jgi:hypothetical protein
MSRSRLLGHLVGPVLPSVVAQALPWCLFVVGDLSLSLPVIPMVVTSRRYRLPMARPCTGIYLRLMLLLKDFISRARCKPL